MCWGGDILDCFSCALLDQSISRPGLAVLVPSTQTWSLGGSGGHGRLARCTVFLTVLIPCPLPLTAWVIASLLCSSKTSPSGARTAPGPLPSVHPCTTQAPGHATFFLLTAVGRLREESGLVPVHPEFGMNWRTFPYLPVQGR